MEKIKEILSHFPEEPFWSIDWNGLECCELLLPWIMEMRLTSQDPDWHGEGDVWMHTRMVCEELAHMEEFRKLPALQRQELFFAALLHDIGKTRCTRQEAGRLVAPHHAAIGARIARSLLWEKLGCSGTRSAQDFRETVCGLIRYHTVPPYLWEREDRRRLVRIAANGELAKSFNIYLLCLLSQADLLGRIALDRRKLAEQAWFVSLLAAETGCLYGPRNFCSLYTQRAYLAGKRNWPDTELYDHTWGEVALLSGLPGTGKDTWIQKNCSDIPVISLDDFRIRLGISAKGSQASVSAAAQEQAREYLRKKQSFVWNATNLTPVLRERLVGIFEGYGAAVRIIFLETGWEEEMHRNSNRQRKVPESVIKKMLNQIVPVERFEAQKVEWYCV